MLPSFSGREQWGRKKRRRTKQKEELRPESEQWMESEQTYFCIIWFYPKEFKLFLFLLYIFFRSFQIQ